MPHDPYDDYDPFDAWLDSADFKRILDEHTRENAYTIATEYVESGILESMLSSRPDLLSTAMKKFDRADARTASGDLDEAMFGGYRTAEGYLKALFLTPLLDALTEPFEARLSGLKFKPRRLLNDRIFDQPEAILLGLTAAGASAPEIEEVVKLIATFRSRLSGARNETFHSLDDPTTDAAKDCVKSARALVSRVDAVFAPHVLRAEIAARRASIWAKNARSYKTFDTDITIGSPVSFVVEDPWEFADENEGRIAFIGEVVANANGHWIVRVARPIAYQGQTWNYIIPLPKNATQRDFRDDESANIILVSDEQATSEEFASAFGSGVKPVPSPLNGSFQSGIYGKIPRGDDSFVDPARKPKA